ncbi:MAG: DNA mismatch repair endonuclease MutL [Lachnospiraceae bacterium]|nr:DNA mismatch repair endonuclease MutL [Lachnospiraceae bacterium]
MGAVIHALDTETINKIAAGEVVERPASVVKELVENAIDAGATAITVEIKEGGIAYIRVTDNGSGIERDQIRTAFLRHTTSKILSAEDLPHIASLGFRGEALSSIAAVSQVELLTKTKQAVTGIRYCIEGARETVFDEAGVPEGTTFIVRNLFFNTPARRKFLKTAQTEGGYISDYMERVMLSHTEISFKFISNSSVKLQSYGNGKPLDIVYSLYGKELRENLVPVLGETPEIRITGYVGRPVLARSTRNQEIYYVNQRYIKSDIIKRALDEAYKPYLMLHKYPFVLLYLELPAETLDVNVHPTKMEVRFLNAMPLYQLLVDAIRDALREQDMTVEVRADAGASDSEDKDQSELLVKEALPEPFEEKRRELVLPPFREDPPAQEPASVQSVRESDREEMAGPVVVSYSGTDEEVTSQLRENFVYERSQKADRPEQLSLFEEERFLSREALPKHRIIGQLFQTYWLIEYHSELYIIDQHAAHEKVKYERLVKRLHEKNIASQQLRPATVVTLSKSEENILQKYLDRFLQLGFEIESFGGSEIRLLAVPTDLYGLSAQEYFLDVLDQLAEEHLSEDVDEVLHRLATMACKSAVKGNTAMTPEEAKALIDELLGLSDPYHCPHGRPAIVKFTKAEIEKMFKRIV